VAAQDQPHLGGGGILINLCDDHLSSISVVQSPSPVVETALSLAVLGERLSGPSATWRTQTASALRRFDNLAEISMLRSASNAAKASTPAAVVELVDECFQSPATPARPELARALRSYYRAVLEPHWPRFQNALDVERGLHARALLRGGPRELLRTIGHGLGWSGCDLPSHAAAPERRPEPPTTSGPGVLAPGTRLVLMPSAFCREVFVLWEPLRATIVHPMAESSQALALAEHRVSTARLALGNLLGRTRAAILHTLSESHTTSEVARRWNISAATASNHLTILREAGLITSQRRSNEVYHLISSLGLAVAGTTDRLPAAGTADRLPAADATDRFPAAAGTTDRLPATVRPLSRSS
jgi:DNA-binding transcriptional ArsR family regulator